MNVVSAGLLLGVAIDAADCFMRLHRHRDITMRSFATNVASGVAIAAGIGLIAAGISGDPGEFRGTWREWAATTGVIATYLAGRRIAALLHH